MESSHASLARYSSTDRLMKPNLGKTHDQAMSRSSVQFGMTPKGNTADAPVRQSDQQSMNSHLRGSHERLFSAKLAGEVTGKTNPSEKNLILQ